MLYNLTILERMVLESLQAQAQNAENLSHSTKMDTKLLQKSLESLISKNLVYIQNQKYRLNSNLNQQILNELNDKTNLMCEVNEIINSCLRKAFEENTTTQTSFKLKKVNMTEREEKIYRGLQYNLESFLNSLGKTNQISEQKVIFWGEGSYEDIKNSILNF